jgi:hypothetical protein
MARGTHLYMEFFFTQGGTGYELVTTTANNFDFLIARMDIRFHDRPTHIKDDRPAGQERRAII